LKQVSRSIKKSNWRASSYFTDVATAHFWGKKPSELGLCEEDDDPAVMEGYYLTSKTMEAYESHLQMKSIEKLKRKGKR